MAARLGLRRRHAARSSRRARAEVAGEPVATEQSLNERRGRREASASWRRRIVVATTEPRPAGDPEALSHAGGRQAGSHHPRRAAARRLSLRLAAPAGARIHGRAADDRRADDAVSIVVDAPLRDHSNPNLTPNPAKAPWYFLGLQEELHYFPPTIAGVLLPGFVLVGLALLPYVDRNPSRAYRGPQALDHVLHHLRAVLRGDGVDRQLLPRLRLAVDLALAGTFLRSLGPGPLM